MVENRFVGMKSRGVYETPGGTVLFHAHREMESLTMDREVMHIRDSLIPKYAQLVYNGFWFAPERDAIQALVEDSQKFVSGEVRMKLYKGHVMAAGRRSPLTLYNEDVATMEGEETNLEGLSAEQAADRRKAIQLAYNQDDATGFIRLNGLRLKSSALRSD